MSVIATKDIVPISRARARLTEPPQIDGNEITDKGYINQRAVLERRAALVEKLYATPLSGEIIALA